MARYDSSSSPATSGRSNSSLSSSPLKKVNESDRSPLGSLSPARAQRQANKHKATSHNDRHRLDRPNHNRSPIEYGRDRYGRQQLSNRQLGQSHYRSSSRSGSSSRDSDQKAPMAVKHVDDRYGRRQEQPRSLHTRYDRSRRDANENESSSTSDSDSDERAASAEYKLQGRNDRKRNDARDAEQRAGQRQGTRGGEKCHDSRQKRNRSPRDSGRQEIERDSGRQEIERDSGRQEKERDSGRQERERDGRSYTKTRRARYSNEKYGEQKYGEERYSQERYGEGRGKGREQYGKRDGDKYGGGRDDKQDDRYGVRHGDREHKRKNDRERVGSRKVRSSSEEREEYRGKSDSDIGDGYEQHKGKRYEHGRGRDMGANKNNHREQRYRDHHDVHGLKLKDKDKGKEKRYKQDEDYKRFQDKYQDMQDKRRGGDVSDSPKKLTEQQGSKADQQGQGQKQQQPNYEQSGALAAEANTVNGVVISYTEPPDACKADRKWRLYVFKGNDVIGEPLCLHRASYYLVGKEQRVVDILAAHPSVSRQHAVLQFRKTEIKGVEGIRPYIMDLESSNGTFINEEKIESKKYYQLLERDLIKFAGSSREYIIMSEDLLSTGA